MKLSSLIAFKNRLDDITPLDTTPLTYDKLTPIMTIVNDHEMQFNHLTDRMNMNYRQILYDFDQFDQTIEEIKTEILELIKQKEAGYYIDSIRFYQSEVANDSAEHILDRRLVIYDEIVDMIKGRLQTYGNWQHAGLIIRPGHEDWVRELVSCDPLYLVDQNLKLLEPAVLRFNDQYQRRLRTYTIDESLTDPMLPSIPNKQIGFCLVYNFFNYKPIEVIEAYLKEIYNKLKAGGSVALTFNDCDRAAGAELFEKRFMCYTPGREVFSRAEAIGFEITYHFRTDQSNTWLELRKPGVLTSFRGGQTLAKVLYKDEYSLYTEEQLKNIRQQALDLNIAIEHLSTGQIVELIKQRTSK